MVNILESVQNRLIPPKCGSSPTDLVLHFSHALEYSVQFLFIQEFHHFLGVIPFVPGHDREMQSLQICISRWFRSSSLSLSCTLPPALTIKLLHLPVYLDEAVICIPQKGSPIECSNIHLTTSMFFLSTSSQFFPKRAK